MTLHILNRIMLVEDEPDIQAVARLALEAIGGFVVTICSSGEQAIREVSSFNPDLILLDVMMPGMDGPSTLKAFRQMPHTDHIPVIFMTAKVQPHEKAQYTQMGALGVIPKPFDPMTLSATIRTIWSTYIDNHDRSAAKAV